MATFRMRVFRYQDGSSDKVWAICRDGERVMVFYGRYTQQYLNGGPIKPKQRDLNEEVSRRMQEQLAQGYRDLGEYSVVEKEIIWKPLAARDKPNANRMIPIAYVGIGREEIEKVRGVLEEVFSVASEADRLIINIPDSMPMECLTNLGEPTLAAFEEHGPIGILAVLAAGEVLKKPVLDREHRARNRNWLKENPETFAEISNLEEMAVVLRLKAPPVKVKESAVRSALW